MFLNLTCRRSALTSSLALLGATALAGCGDAGVPGDSNGAGGLSAGTGGGVGTGGIAGTGSVAGTGSTAATGGTGAAPGSGGGSGGSGEPVVNPNCPGMASEAYLMTPGSVPGTIEAENFDPLGYSDATEGNEGGAYRTDVDADVKELGAGHAVGWMTAGEWLEYTVNVATAGDYQVVLHAGAVDAGRTLSLSVCDAELATNVAIPEIADWGEIATVTSGAFHLDAGLQVIRVTVGDADYLDLDALEFVPAEAGTGGTGGSGGSGGSDGSGGQIPKFVGNITTYDQMDTDGRVFSTYWDQVTPENAGKWGSVQPTASSPMGWGTLDAIYDYAMDKGILFKQHVFVWGAQQPTGTITEQHVRNWIETFCERYPETKIIDVVNEPPPHTTPSYANAIGGGTNGSWQWIINAFEWTREACGEDAVLILNDYNNIEYGDQNQHFIDIANTVLEAGAPLDALGVQAHGLSGSISGQTMRNLITKMHDDTGLPIYVTEYDIDLADDNAQLAKYQDHMGFFLETEWIHGITVWGWIHGKTWIPNSGLIRSNGTPRPAMTWLMEELDRPAP